MPIGPIPATDLFAGRVLERPLSGGYLYRCTQCSLGFRWPRLSKEELDTLYVIGKEEAWTAAGDSRIDWRIARGWIEQNLSTESRVLDIGCFDGGFLEPLVGSYRCYGIEIHSAARNRAEQKGIEVIGNDFSAVSGNFDCITAFDVIEHVERPGSFLDDCLAAVRPRGWVLISSGNLDAFTFRLMGSRYWYCTIAEHISFVSPAWFLKLACVLDYQIVRRATFAHGNTSRSRYVKQLASNLMYRFGGSGFRILRKLGMGGKNVKTYPELADHPPSWMSAPDHFMVMMQKR
ncbi:MAG: class I SAM-dependent methyltransferase [Cellvibrionaceae bacterium]